MAKIITYGQAHCHGLSSSFAASLLPFSHALGIDVRYRFGDHFAGDQGTHGTAQHSDCRVGQQLAGECLQLHFKCFKF